MNKRFKSSELVLNSDGSVYHLKLHTNQVADNIIVVGDPNRVSKVSSFFDNIELKVENREIHTHTGQYKGKRITVLSTGMGPDNIDIVMNELHILAAYDIENKRLLEHPAQYNIIRLGTSGAYQKDIPIGSFIASEYAIGIDGVLNFYGGDKSGFENSLADSFSVFTNWPNILAKPYACKCSEMLMNKIAKDLNRGITLTAPGFYGPQFRNLFIPPIDLSLETKIIDFSYNNLKVTNLEMESSALYGFGKLMNHNMLTVCLIIANRINGDFLKDYKPKINELIEIVLTGLISVIERKTKS